MRGAIRNPHPEEPAKRAPRRTRISVRTMATQRSSASHITTRAPSRPPPRGAPRRPPPNRRGGGGSCGTRPCPRAPARPAGRSPTSANPHFSITAREASFSTLTLARISTAGVSPKPASIIAWAASVARPLPQASGASTKPSARRSLAARFEADRADRVALALDRRHDQGQVASGGVGFARRVDESLSRAEGIGVGDAGGIARDFPLAAKFMDRRGVADSRPAQPKPRRLDAEHIVSGKIGEHGSSGQGP